MERKKPRAPIVPPHGDHTSRCSQNMETALMRKLEHCHIELYDKISDVNRNASGVGVLQLVNRCHRTIAKSRFYTISLDNPPSSSAS